MRAKAFAWSLLLGVAAVGTVAGCGEEGVTPTGCKDPELPLYDVSQAGERNDPEVQDAIQAQVDRGCLSPIGTARSGEAPPSGNTGNGGAAGAGG